MFSAIVAALSCRREVVLTQKTELKEQLRRPYVERLLPPQAVAETNLIRVIVGPRRAGKSTLAVHLLQRLGGGGYANYEDERLAGLTDADALLAALDERGLSALHAEPVHAQGPRTRHGQQENLRGGSGLAVCLGTRPGQDLGRLAENVVALALWRRQWAGEIEVAFWKNRAHEEVDFVLRKRGRVARLIQVCWDLSDPRTRAREFRALGKVAADLCCDDLWCLTRGAGGDEDFTWNGRTHRIRVVSIDKWAGQT